MKKMGIGVVLLVFMILRSNNASEEKIKCKLMPGDYGVYYGTYDKTFENHKKCCESKNLTILNLGTDELGSGMWRVLHDILLAFPTTSSPIGKMKGVWVELNHSKVHYDKIEGEVTPCFEVHLKSSGNITMILHQLRCNSTIRFVCVPYYTSPNRIDEPECKKGGMTASEVLPYMHFSNIALSWKGYIPPAKNEESDMLSALFESTSPTKLENCITAVTSPKSDQLVIKDAACTSELPFICKDSLQESKGRDRCSEINFMKLSMPSRSCSYWYSGSIRFNFLQAQRCCKKLGWTLFPMISPEVGQQIAAILQSTPTTRHRHQGLSYGIWTSASGQRKVKEHYLYHYHPSHSNISLFLALEENGMSSMPKGNEMYNFFMPRRETLIRSCLQFVVDSRNSFFLHDEDCHFKRSFICEEPVNICEEPVNTTGLVDLGNKYFLGINVGCAKEATALCDSNHMTVAQLEYAEEDNALAGLIRDQCKNSTNLYENGTWFFANARRLQLNESSGVTTYQMNSSLPTCYKLHRDSTKTDFVSTNCSDSVINYVICEKGTVLKGSVDAKKICQNDSFSNTEGRYHLSNYTTTWEEARRCCSSLGYELISLVQKEPTKPLFYALNELEASFGPKIGVWTSGKNSIIFGKQFIWVDSIKFLSPTTPFYHNYYDTTNVDPINQDQCLEAIADTQLREPYLTVSADECQKTKRFVCGPQTKPQKLNCDEIQYVRIAEQYHISKEIVPFFWAAYCCYRSHGSLAQLVDPRINQLIKASINDRQKKNGDELEIPQLWFGLVQATFNKTEFVWTSNGLPLKANDYQPWAAPDNGTQDNQEHHCVAAFATSNMSNLAWIPVDCDKPKQYLCSIHT